MKRKFCTSTSKNLKFKLLHRNKNIILLIHKNSTQITIKIKELLNIKKKNSFFRVDNKEECCEYDEIPLIS